MNAFRYAQNDLFKSGPNFKLNACVGKNGGPYNFRDYSKGYFEAAQRIAASSFSTPHLIDVMIYPLVYLFRHGIELGLKHLAQKLPLIFDEKNQVHTTHRLLDNWLIVRRYLEQLPDGGNDPQPIQTVDRVLKDFVQLDPKGEAFRFPQSTDGQPYLDEVSVINIGVLAEAMKDVREAFDFWFTVTETLRDIKAEEFFYYQRHAAEMLWYGPQ